MKLNEPGKSRRNIMRSGVQLVLFTIENVSRLVDVLKTREREYDVRLPVQCLDEPLQIRWLVNVVVRRPFEIRATCNLKYPVEVPHRTHVRRVANVSYAPVPPGQFAANRFR